MSPDARALAHLRPPTPEEEVLISREASVQFAGQPAFVFRVISVCPKPTYAGWLWVTGYQLDGPGNAVAKREIYVRLAGLKRVHRADGPGSGSALVSRPGARRTPPQQRS
ncbi:hypothetical protein [Micromonospora okii]|uniref:hypothetical protein n=1 Tax=Micromonospora okii TaxID=1182970 RepID=UPI001E5E0811|nr:hypothetical protein [Micromonospora okii]